MKLMTTSSPHIRDKNSTRRIMLDVVISLIPALAVGIWQLGARAAIVVLVSVISAIIGEWALNYFAKRKNTLTDGSAIVTGLLLAMTLPASVPYWTAAVGAVFATIVVKGISGGIGKNVFNPALGARAFLMLCWPMYLVRFAAPGTKLPLGPIEAADVVTSATTLHHMQMPSIPEMSMLYMSGSIGELSAVALLLGGLYLLIRKVINLRIPAAYLGTVAVLTLVFYRGEQPLVWMAYNLLSGGVILGALFMATDYTTSPVTSAGQWVFGAGCGILTVVFRYFGLFPEGVTYAILLMNATVWFLDRYLVPRRFGTKRRA